MSSSDWLHLKLNKLLLEVFGVWPYQSQTKKRRNYLIFATCSISLILPLIQGLAEKTNWNAILYFGTIACILYLAGGLYLVTIMYIKPHRLTRLYEQIEIDSNEISRKEELAIIDDFSRQAKSLIFKFTGMVLFAIPMFITVNYLPLVYPKSQDYSAIFSVYSDEWIIYENLRRLQVILHISIVGSWTAFVYIATVGVYLSSVKHACGMYTIVSYRLQKVMRAREMIPKKKTENNHEIIAELLDVVTKHREAIESVQLIKRAFARMFYTVQIGALICFAILIFGLQLSFNMRSIHLGSRVIAMGPVFIVYIFYLNYGGEQIIEFSNSVFTTTYFVDWHLMPVEARKILLMIILRSSKGDALNGGTMTMSLQNFARIMYASWSMAAVLLSVES